MSLTSLFTYSSINFYTPYSCILIFIPISTLYTNHPISIYTFYISTSVLLLYPYFLIYKLLSNTLLNCIISRLVSPYVKPHEKRERFFDIT